MNRNSQNQLAPEQIAAHAYSIWEEEGRPHGRDMEFWFQAEAQLQAMHKQGLNEQIRAEAEEKTSRATKGKRTGSSTNKRTKARTQ